MTDERANEISIELTRLLRPVIEYQSLILREENVILAYETIAGPLGHRLGHIQIIRTLTAPE